MEFPAPPVLHVMHVPGSDPYRDKVVQRMIEQAEVCLHLDPERKGIMPNWLGALDCAAERDQDYSWSVIVQDDADPFPGWQQHLERACTHSPMPFLSLTYFGAYGDKPLAKGAPYAVGDALAWGGAIAYHRSMVRPLERWARRIYEEDGYPHDDNLVAAFAKRKGLKMAMVARAIFNQPSAQEAPSLVGHNTPVRTPAKTILDHGPAWSATPRSIALSSSIGPKGTLEELAAR